MGKKQKDKQILQYRNDIVNYDVESEIEVEEKRSNKAISIFQLNEICNDFQSKVNELNDLIISERNMKQKFFKIGKKRAFEECIQTLSDLIY